MNLGSGAKNWFSGLFTNTVINADLFIHIFPLSLFPILNTSI